MAVNFIDEMQCLTSEHMQMLEALINTAAKKLNLPEDFEVDVTIVDDEEIKELNEKYRAIESATDVLSFPTIEDVDEIDIVLPDWMQEEIPLHLGDIIISNEKVIAQSKEYGHSYERELGFLTVHGFLHLNGYDHQTPEEEKEMFGLQEEVLQENGLTR